MEALGQKVIRKPAKSEGLVIDEAKILSPSEEQALDKMLVAYGKETSTQITVVTVKSLGGYEIADYAFELGEEWGVGQREKDNGVVILVAPNDRKAFIATGYGLEDRLPDAYAKRIIEKVMLPHFRNDNYFKGIQSSVREIKNTLMGVFSADDMEQDFRFPWEILIMLALFVLFIYIMNKRGGGNKGNGRKTYKRGKVEKHPNPYPWGRPRGGQWGDFRGGRGVFGGGGTIIIPGGGGFPRGGGGGGSFGGGGGFGGFGGGSFGGGGAGGSW